MEKYFKIITVVFFLVITISCSKDDETSELKTYPEENPLALYLEKSGFNQSTANHVNTLYSEQGFQFKPKVKGIMKAVILKIPDNATNIRVTIWNADTHVIIKTITVPNVNANTEIRQEIEPLEIVPETRYSIVFNGNDYYERLRANGSELNTPIDAGNISVSYTVFVDGNSQNYPWPTQKKSYLGDISFVFQQTK